MDEENQKAELLRKLSNDAMYISYCGCQIILRDKCNRWYGNCLILIENMVPLFKELEKIREQISERTLRLFEEALDMAKNLAQLVRCGCKLYMALKREEINNKFKNTSLCFERALSSFSNDELNTPDHRALREKVQCALEFFKELITSFDAPDSKSYEDMSCVYNQSKLCRKLHICGVEDIKRESQVLKKVMDMKKVMNIPGDGNLEEIENKMSVLLEKLKNFLESQTVPDDFRCPISWELMRDPVIICTGKTYERANIEKWVNEGNRTCPVTRKTLDTTSTISNRALQSFIRKWDCINGMEPFEKFGKSLSKLTFNHVEQVFGRGETGLHCLIVASTYQCSQSPGVPNEFVCYLSERQQPDNCQESTKLMKDPVIICTGETYERASIVKWLKAGHITCPLTAEYLSSPSLTPNHALYNLISNWREVNGLNPFERSSSSDQGMVVSTDYAEGAGLDILLRKLTFDKSEDWRSAAGELYYLDKHSYSILIPQLVELLSSSDTDIQKRAIITLYQLSFGVRDSRHCIISSEAVPRILDVLKSGSMEARRFAAFTFWSLSTSNEYRETLGASGAIPALLKLLKDGSPWEKRASALALSELCKYEGNQGLAISAGVVSIMWRELTNFSMAVWLVPGSSSYCSIFDEALDVMKLLVSHPDGKAAIIDCRPVPFLLELLIIGSPRNKEIVLAILSQMQSRLALNVPHHPQAKELKQILLDLNISDDITSDKAKRDFINLICPFISGILYVLENGSMEARGGAAVTFWSLSTSNEYRETLGASGVIPALVKLLKDGSHWEKRASVLALSELCKYEGNQGLAISAGVVSTLLGELTESSRSMEDRRITYCSIFDEALDIMKLLVSHPDGKAAIRDCRLVPVLLELLVIGSPRNKESVLAILIKMQSHLKLKELPQAKELEQILLDLNEDDITSKETNDDFINVLISLSLEWNE